MDEKKVDTAEVVEKPLDTDGVKLKAEEPSSTEPEAPVAEAERAVPGEKEKPIAPELTKPVAPEAPPGFTLVPTEAIERLQATSALFKAKPRVVELAAKEPEFGSAVEELGHAIGGVSAAPVEKRATATEGSEPTPESQQAVVLLLALGALGGLILLSQRKAEQQK
jgi:hypothetical protein